MIIIYWIDFNYLSERYTNKWVFNENIYIYICNFINYSMNKGKYVYIFSFFLF